jgi:response regulator NasT
MALDSDRDIKVATGITMMQYRLPRTAAFELLRSASRSQRRKLSEVATEAIQVCEKLHS